MNRRNTQDLLDIMARLRAPDGCPWDRKQTHESILNNLIEEAYEFIDAVENRDTANMKEELGDILLQVVFQAQMAKEAGTFDYEDVVEVISEKLVRRHPHVFGEAVADNPEAVQKQWDEIKAQEKAGRTPSPGAGEVVESALGQVPKHLPALLKAEKIQKKAAGLGFDWPDYKGPLAKVREELGEFEAEIRDGNHERMESEFGDLLFAAVNVARFFKIDPEKALARANRKFVSRYGTMETLAKAEGRDLKGLSLEEQDGYWNKAKETEKP
jgi:tetrapyrrole methylase family protein/MazG family protein